MDLWCKWQGFDFVFEKFAIRFLSGLTPFSQVQRRRSEAQGTNSEAVGVSCNVMLGWGA
jgi:hypothetical protein